ncbi:MAG: hypothetical protein RE471_05380 [Ferroplasma sp.]|uniref:Trm112 family protein n=1 Tax=Ferroplasma sp. TaxID=2591003 RepID=UPI00281562C6|nr:Trm112 family protein [Ferroplasma sp.]WMT50415.1 MAG: hypothetical protein RE471_05380 [Ferroplasma sp.]
MNSRFFEVLQCPECGKSTFEILVFTDKSGQRYVWNENGDGKMGTENPLDNKNGIIRCSSCGSWYPVKDGIPVMLRQEIRDRDKDKQFLETYKRYIPEDLQVI